MNRATSLYLDLLRFAAAFAVFMSHYATQRRSGGLFWRLAPLGPDAVIVFFVLSGFVIAYVVHTRERSPLPYAASRLARIYSVALPALLFTFALDAIGFYRNPASYLSWQHYRPDNIAGQFLQAMSFTTEIWWNDLSPGMNQPYWSLSFEVWYYVIFGILAFAPRRYAASAAALILMATGPKIAIGFPLWLAGALSYACCVKLTVSPRKGLALWIASSAAAAAVLIHLQERHGLFGMPDFRDAGQAADLLHLYLLAASIAVNLYAITCASPYFGALGSFAGPIRWLGGRTFALYLFHMPVMEFIVAVAPWPTDALPTRVLMFLVPLAVSFAAAEFTEQRKHRWRVLFERMLGRASAIRARPAA